MVSVFSPTEAKPKSLTEFKEQGAILIKGRAFLFIIQQPFAYRALVQNLSLDWEWIKPSMDWRAVQAWKRKVVVISSGRNRSIHYLHHQSYLISYCKENRIPFLSHVLSVNGMGHGVDQDL